MRGTQRETKGTRLDCATHARMCSIQAKCAEAPPHNKASRSQIASQFGCKNRPLRSTTGKQRKGRTQAISLWKSPNTSDDQSVCSAGSKTWEGNCFQSKPPGCNAPVMPRDLAKPISRSSLRCRSDCSSTERVFRHKTGVWLSFTGAEFVGVKYGPMICCSVRSI